MTVSRLTIWIAVASIVYRLAPGEPSWMDPNDVGNLEHPLPPIGKWPGPGKYSIQRFVGGDGTTSPLVGRLYEPLSSTTVVDSTAVPIIVLAHGLGLTQDAHLKPFVNAWLEQGLAVFTFDYATFGWSAGWPRHQVNPKRHIADLKAAIAHIRQNLNDRVDATRIGLAGISLGGGHVLSVAASDPDILATVAMVPHIRSGLEGILGTLRRNPLHATIGLVKVVMALGKGCILASLFQAFSPAYSPMYIPLHGLPGSAAMMQNPGDYEGYGRLVQDLPSSLQWKNLASVGSVLPVLFYRPLNVVAQIQSSTLIIAAELDTLCPAADSKAAFQSMDSTHAQLITLEGLSHFDIYEGSPLQSVLEYSTAFFKKSLWSSIHGDVNNTASAAL